MIRLLIFFQLVFRRHYEDIIGPSLAWELAGIFAEYADELSKWERLR